MKRKIDWQEVQQRLRKNELALDEVLTPNAERIERVFRERAARLASVAAGAKPSAEALFALVFRLGQERYAIELKELAEVLPFAGCAPVPGSSGRFLGVMNVRGELRAVLDLRNLFALPPDPDHDAGFVLMLRRAPGEIGLKVDHIEELQQISTEDLLPSLPGSFGRRLASGMLVLLNVDAVVAEVFLKKESHAL